MLFHVRQRVICIRNQEEGITPHGWEIMPIVGVKYTIRSIFEIGDDLGVLLAEIHNKPDAYVLGNLPLVIREFPFPIEWFAPEDDESKKDALSIFRHYVSTHPKTEDELIDSETDKEDA